MKIKTLKISAISTVMLGMSLMSTVYASEVTGTLTTGLSSTVSVVEGVVITPPAVSPVAGTYTSAQSVTLTAVGSLSIRYTRDGSTPSCTVGTLYTAPISLDETKTIKAISCYAQDHSSTVASYLYTINIPISVGGGGGGSSSGGGGGYSYVDHSRDAENERLEKERKDKEKKDKEKKDEEERKKKKGRVLGASTFNFQKDVQIGVQNEDVKELQKILIAEGLLKGTATGYFGAMTKTALIKWQIKNKLEAKGVFGPASRNFINVQNEVEVTPTTATASTTPSYVFTKDLKLGARGDGVKELQKALIAGGHLTGEVTGYFGPMTKKALAQWQAKNGLPATGFFGPMSRNRFGK
jgi:peptidoglycan hydrolase-like protein with peptidoglycan-binding domain